MTTGVNIGDAAMSILRDHDGSLAEAVSQLEHLTATKAELWEAVAYLACQVAAYRRIANEDAALAIAQIRTSVDSYYSRRGVTA